MSNLPEGFDSATLREDAETLRPFSGSPLGRRFARVALATDLAAVVMDGEEMDAVCQEAGFRDARGEDYIVSLRDALLAAALRRGTP